jgi:hypothetical protein
LWFDAKLTRPQPGDQRLFWRNKRLSIKQQAGSSAYACESAMEDRIHDIKISFQLSNEGCDFPGAKPRCAPALSRLMRRPTSAYAGLNGLRVTSAFVAQFAEQVGGASGCTHLFDLSIDVLRLFKFSN